ncbi:MAG: GntR family transcriptional regulator [Lachnospiraceae bacterium]|nr:GntR family transcriptional regulator [Lachnospiraceae bacterium]
MELDNNSTIPLYKQLESILIEQIESGVLSIGSKLPTEDELSKEYNISRVTVRKAMEALTNGCFIERKPGKGTFVSSKKIQRNISALLSFTDMCQMQGLKATAKTIRIDIIDPTEDESIQMGLNPHEKILILERLRYADNLPVTIEISKLPEEFFFLFEEDLTNSSLYTAFKKHNIYLTNSVKTLEIVHANYKEATLLNVPKNHPLLCITSVVSDALGNHQHLSKQLSVADKFKFII